jgi:hypothetical protein
VLKKINNHKRLLAGKKKYPILQLQTLDYNLNFEMKFKDDISEIKLPSID